MTDGGGASTVAVQEAAVAAVLAGARRAGPVVKQGHRVRSWRPRYLVLPRDGRELVYYRGAPPGALVEKGRVPLRGAAVVDGAAWPPLAPAPRAHVFVVVTARGVAYPVQAADAADHARWLRELRRAVAALSQSQAQQQAQQAQAQAQQQETSAEALLAAAGAHGVFASVPAAAHGALWASPVICPVALGGHSSSGSGSGNGVARAAAGVLREGGGEDAGEAGEAECRGAGEGGVCVRGTVAVGDHTEYVVAVRWRGAAWTVQRRYRAFRELHAALLRELPAAGLARHVLPPRRAFGTRDADFLAERRMLLQSYLRELVADPVACQSVAFRTFVELDQHVGPLVL